MDGVGLVLIALTAFTFLQIVPLPPSFVQFFSPQAFALHDAALIPLGEAHRDGWFPLSVDPTATALAAIAMTAVTFTYLTVRQRLRAHGGRAVLHPLVGAGALVAVVFFLHRLAGWTKAYDEYVPLYVSGTALSAPFLNANHLAGALGFAAALAFGLAPVLRRAVPSADPDRRGRHHRRRLLHAFRGGILAFAAGRVLFLVLRFTARNRGRRRRWTHEEEDDSGDEAGAESGLWRRDRNRHAEGRRRGQRDGLNPRKVGADAAGRARPGTRTSPGLPRRPAGRPSPNPTSPTIGSSRSSKKATARSGDRAGRRRR